MRAETGIKIWLLSSALMFSFPLVASHAQASPDNRYHHSQSNRTYRLNATYIPAHNGSHGFQTMRMAGRSLGVQHHGISCVPYARQVSGILVAGNAWQWWQNAEGLYARGDRPEPGSVLNFRSNGRMRLGHVAVVRQVVNAREVLIDQANWPTGGGYGGVSHNVAVVDVSEANNWSAVRVELGRAGEFGSVYPTYGFIYNRPDTGVVTASVSRPAPQPEINPVPSDLRPIAERPWHTVEEVAEAPSSSHHRINVTFTPGNYSLGQ